MSMVQEQTFKNTQIDYARQYKLQEIAGASQEELVLHIYDFAIQGCVRKDEECVSKALAELIDSLNFDYQEISVGLFRLYEYMMRLVKTGVFEQPLDLLRKLRETWYEAITKRKAA